VRNPDRKIRKTLSYCEVCQKVKHPNQRYEAEIRSHLPTKAGELVSVDLFGPLPSGRFGNKYILVCLDIFTKHVKLYPLKSATAQACLTNITQKYVPTVIHPDAILSDHGTPFTSENWQRSLEELNMRVKYSPIRHPESNPSERFMREISQFFRIYCHTTQKSWPQLLRNIEYWLNNTISEATNFTSAELMFGSPKPNPFIELLPTVPGPLLTEETLEEKAIKAYTRMKQRAAIQKERCKKGVAKWEPMLRDPVLVRIMPLSDADIGVTGKFIRPLKGP
jgi:hypothetical protein